MDQENSEADYFKIILNPVAKEEKKETKIKNLKIDVNF